MGCVTGIFGAYVAYSVCSCDVEEQCIRVAGFSGRCDWAVGAEGCDVAALISDRDVDQFACDWFLGNGEGRQEQHE